MRCPECASQRTKVVRMREMAAVPRVTYALIAINVIVYLTEQGQFTLTGDVTGRSSTKAICIAPRSPKDTSTTGW